MIPLREIDAARERIQGIALRTPLLRLPGSDLPAEIWLKLENLQPTGSFKIRGAANAIRSAGRAAISRGILTCSTGNMAQAVAWMARAEGVPATVVVPDHVPGNKVEAVERLGGRVVKVSHDRWWQTLEERRFEGFEGHFVHPVMDDSVMAGNGTLGRELVEELEAIDCVLVPWGGGGLTTGIASAMRQLNPNTRVITVEPATAAPMAAAFAAGRPVDIEYRPSFVEGAGGRALLTPMWERAHQLIADACAITPEQTAAAIQMLAARLCVIAEGAGALALAAALAGRGGGGRVVCVVSGGNIGNDRLASLLLGKIPT